MLGVLVAGDVVTVTRIDRLARSTFDLFAIVKRIAAFVQRRLRPLTLRSAPEAVLAQWDRSELLEVEFMIANGRAFSLSPAIGSLADAERSAFAGRIGAGIIDIVMNALGYPACDSVRKRASTQKMERRSFEPSFGSASRRRRAHLPPAVLSLSFRR
jgi:hypothetical protein